MRGTMGAILKGFDQMGEAFNKTKQFSHEIVMNFESSKSENLHRH